MHLCSQPFKTAPRMIPSDLQRHESPEQCSVCVCQSMCVRVSSAWSALLQSGTVISTLTEGPLSLLADVEKPKH